MAQQQVNVEDIARKDAERCACCANEAAAHAATRAFLFQKGLQRIATDVTFEEIGYRLLGWSVPLPVPKLPGPNGRTWDCGLDHSTRYEDIYYHHVPFVQEYLDAGPPVTIRAEVEKSIEKVNKIVANEHLFVYDEYGARRNFWFWRADDARLFTKTLTPKDELLPLEGRSLQVESLHRLMRDRMYHWYTRFNSRKDDRVLFEKLRGYFQPYARWSQESRALLMTREGIEASIRRALGENCLREYNGKLGITLRGVAQINSRFGYRHGGGG